MQRRRRRTGLLGQTHFSEHWCSIAEALPFGSRTCAQFPERSRGWKAWADTRELSVLSAYSAICVRTMPRTASLIRETKETRVEVTIDLDGTGKHDVETPLPF